jgi:2-polyprenyl-3-methyl-5-hydroxy-6-metoxy-1,4-benzoquinol methylase
MTAMRTTSYDTFEGVDISPTSVEMTRALIESGHFGQYAGYSVTLLDVVSEQPARQRYQAIVMGEVLEHVEDPLALMRRICELADGSAFIYVTTAINAPAIDHIYLFDSIDSVLDLVRRSGLVAREQLALAHAGLSVETALRDRMPINIALVLQKPAGEERAS